MHKVVRLALAAVAVWVVWGGAAFGQNIVGSAVTGGVAISPEGLVQVRQTAAVSRNPNGETGVTYVSLPRALAAMKGAMEAGKPVPADVRFLHGLTQIRNVFVFPGDHDVVLAGPGEGIKGETTLSPVGAVSGRPVVQLEDLIVAMRAVGGNGNGGRRDFYGCSLDPPQSIAEIWAATMKRFGTGPRATLVAEMKKAIGPQEVKLFGVAEDSRLALAMVAADYRLKRLAIGLEPLPTGIGTILGTGETSARRIWFEPAYEPLLVSEDGNSYELRGPRLKVECGAQVFDNKGATDFQKKFAARFSGKMNEVAGRVDAVADLQNVVDCFMVAAILKQDQVGEKAGVDFSWAMTADQCKVQSLPVPRTAETIVHVTGNIIVQGGVAVTYKGLSGVERGKDAKVKFTTQPVRPAEGWYSSAVVKSDKVTK